MKKLIPLLFLFACAGTNEPASSATEAPTAPVVEAPVTPDAAPVETPAQVPDAGLACDSANPKKCNVDADCACGSDRASGACAFGTAACIDTQKQCPDFCTGITGTMQLACVNNVCEQKLGAPPQPK